MSDWNVFRKKHKGEGLQPAELSKMYKKAKSEMQKGKAEVIEPAKPGKKTTVKVTKAMMSKPNVVTIEGGKVGKVGFMPKEDLMKVEQRIKRLDAAMAKQVPADKKVVKEKADRLSKMIDKQLKNL